MHRSRILFERRPDDGTNSVAIGKYLTKGWVIRVLSWVIFGSLVALWGQYFIMSDNLFPDNVFWTKLNPGTPNHFME